MTSVLRFCIKCKADRDVDGISFACLTCGTLTKYTGTPQALTASVAAPSVVTLPASTGSRRWMEQTKALADGFRAAAKAAEAKAQAETAEAERLRRAASAFDSLLKQVALEESAAEAKAIRNSLNGRWSRDYDACRDCGRTDRKHVARGYCVTCQAKPANRTPAA